MANPFKSEWMTLKEMSVRTAMCSPGNWEWYFYNSKPVKRCFWVSGDKEQDRFVYLLWMKGWK